jgi:hypothetical protein
MALLALNRGGAGPMITKWFCVNCDVCGDSGPLTETPAKARREAIALGWIARLRGPDGERRLEDVCPKHDRTEP